jgi:hypothetical protein
MNAQHDTVAQAGLIAFILKSSSESLLSKNGAVVFLGYKFSMEFLKKSE